MTDEELNKIGQEIFKFVKDNFPNALTWPTKSRYALTTVHGDTVLIIYQRTFKTKSDKFWPSDSLYIKKENLKEYNSENIFLDSLCKYFSVKNVKKVN